MWIKKFGDVHDSVGIGQRRNAVDLLIDDEIGFDVARRERGYACRAQHRRPGATNVARR